jgi:hypothetical protein
MNSSTDYWFPAKRYGWGWGLPQRAQGWVVLAVYAVALGALVWLLPPTRNELGFVASVLVLTAVLVLVCWLKGEPPRWRWGGS